MGAAKVLNKRIEVFHCENAIRPAFNFQRSLSCTEDGKKLLLSRSTQTAPSTEDTCSDIICPKNTCIEKICPEQKKTDSYTNLCTDVSKLKMEVQDLCSSLGVTRNWKQDILKTQKVKKYLQEITSAIKALESDIDKECTVKPDISDVLSSNTNCLNRKTDSTLTDIQYRHKDNQKDTLKLWTDLFTLRVFPHLPEVRTFTLEKYFQSLANGASSTPSQSDGACSIGRECMSNELLRLSSLRTFPRGIDISLIRLAKTGFYQNGQPGETKCYSCGVTYRNWKSGDNPVEIHRRLSPGCTLVSNNEERISSLQNNVSVENNSSEARNYPGGQNLDEINSSQLLSENNIATTSSSTSSAALNPSQGRNTNRTSESRSTEQNQPSLQTNENNGRPTHEISESVSSNQQASNNGGFETLGINIDKPKYPNYATLQTRISSYQGWPGYLDQTPRDMAMAGFLFAGYNDYTRCFFCGGGLRNWEAGDDPWVEHARWFPQCAFLKQNKGERFIQAVLKKQQEVEQESMRTSGQSRNPTSQPPLPAATNQKPNPRNIVTENDPLGSIAARSVLEMGYSKDQVLGALKKISSRPGLKETSATDIMRIILKEEDDKELSCQGAAGNEMKQNSSENVAVSEVIPELFNDEETQALMEENRQLRDQRICKVCMDLEATIAFLPCGHIVCCSDCAPAMRKCPLCRTFIKGTVKTFLA